MPIFGGAYIHLTPGVDLENFQTSNNVLYINILITKRRSIIAPKSHDNYFVHPNVATLAILNFFFWRFNSKMYDFALPCYEQPQKCVYQRQRARKRGRELPLATKGHSIVSCLLLKQPNAHG